MKRNVSVCITTQMHCVVDCELSFLAKCNWLVHKEELEHRSVLIILHSLFAIAAAAVLVLLSLNLSLYFWQKVFAVFNIFLFSRKQGNTLKKQFG